MDNPFHDTWPASLVWVVILAQVRELGERAITVGATLAAGPFVFRESGCEAALAAREPCSMKAKRRNELGFFQNVLGKLITAERNGANTSPWEVRRTPVRRYATVAALWRAPPSFSTLPAWQGRGSPITFPFEKELWLPPLI